MTRSRVLGALRRAAWALGAPLRLTLIAVIRLYRLTLSGWLGGQCRFEPTCSHYAEDAIRARGAFLGAALAAWRVLRCSPLSRGGLDPAPRARRQYGTVILREHEEVAA